MDFEFINVYIIYIVLILIWVFIVAYLQLYKTDYLGYAILGIPFIVFLINVFDTDLSDELNVKQLTSKDEITVAIILLFPLLAWLDRDHSAEDKNRFISIIIVAIILDLFGYIIFWIPPRYNYILNRLKTGLVTLSLALVIYALYSYYSHRLARTLNANLTPTDLLNMSLAK
jgi:hypothetical protein